MHYAASRLSRDVAEDLAQEVLLLLHEKYAHLTQVQDLLPVSLQILRFKMMALQRKAQRRGEYTQVPLEERPVADGGPDPEAQAERRENFARLAAAVERLGGRCKELLRLKLQGRSFAEIQSVLGAGSINTVYTWDARCRQHLLELMEGRWEREK